MEAIGILGSGIIISYYDRLKKWNFNKYIFISFLCWKEPIYEILFTFCFICIL